MSQLSLISQIAAVSSILAITSCQIDVPINNPYDPASDDAVRARATIRGTIQLQGATNHSDIRVYLEGWGSAAAYTDEQGRFELRDVESGTAYVLLATYEGNAMEGYVDLRQPLGEVLRPGEEYDLPDILTLRQPPAAPVMYMAERLIPSTNPAQDVTDNEIDTSELEQIATGSAMAIYWFPAEGESTGDVDSTGEVDSYRIYLRHRDQPEFRPYIPPEETGQRAAAITLSELNTADGRPHRFVVSGLEHDKLYEFAVTSISATEPPLESSLSPNTVTQFLWPIKQWRKTDQNAQLFSTAPQGYLLATPGQERLYIRAEEVENNDIKECLFWVLREDTSALGCFRLPLRLPDGVLEHVNRTCNEKALIVETPSGSAQEIDYSIFVPVNDSYIAENGEFVQRHALAFLPSEAALATALETTSPETATCLDQDTTAALFAPTFVETTEEIPASLDSLHVTRVGETPRLLATAGTSSIHSFEFSDSNIVPSEPIYTHPDGATIRKIDVMGSTVFIYDNRNYLISAPLASLDDHDSHKQTLITSDTSALKVPGYPVALLYTTNEIRLVTTQSLVTQAREEVQRLISLGIQRLPTTDASDNNSNYLLYTIHNDANQMKLSHLRLVAPDNSGDTNAEFDTPVQFEPMTCTEACTLPLGGSQLHASPVFTENGQRIVVPDAVGVQTFFHTMTE